MKKTGQKFKNCGGFGHATPNCTSQGGGKYSALPPKGKGKGKTGKGSGSSQLGKGAWGRGKGKVSAFDAWPTQRRGLGHASGPAQRQAQSGQEQLHLQLSLGCGHQLHLRGQAPQRPQPRALCGPVLLRQFGRLPEDSPLWAPRGRSSLQNLCQLP